MPAAIPITYKGQVFKTKDRLAKHLGISTPTLEKRIRDGVPEGQWGAQKPIRTSKRARPSDQITYQGKVFESRVALAAYLGIPVGRLKARIRDGWPEERWGEESRKKPSFISYRGTTYRAAELAKHLGIERGVLEFRVKSGWPEERWGETPSFVKEDRLKPVQYKGKTFKRVDDLADYLGVEVGLLRGRIAKGEPEEAWTKPSRTKWAKGLTFKGKFYNNLRELAEDAGVSYDRLRKWVAKLEGDLEKSVEKARVNNNLRPINYKGKIFKTMTALSDYLGVHLVTLRERIERGLPEEAWVTGRVRGVGYCLADMPEEVQQMAISLAESLGKEPAEAYALMVEKLA